MRENMRINESRKIEEQGPGLLVGPHWVSLIAWQSPLYDKYDLQTKSSGTASQASFLILLGSALFTLAELWAARKFVIVVV